MALSDLFIFLEKSRYKIEIPLQASFLMILAGLVLGGLSASVVDGQLFFHIHSIFNMPTLASLLIVGAAIFSSKIQNALEHPIIIFLGKISFPLYLFHPPIMGSIGCAFYIYLRNVAFSHLIAALFSSILCISCSVLVAWGAYYAVELPAIRAAKKFSNLFYSPQSSVVAAK
jgi:peptidoglycan/LPS O-acetylase OafA/YrhL